MINLTYESVGDVVMARGALRHYLGHERPATLNRDHSEALEKAIATAWGAVALSLLPYVVDYGVDDGRLTMELRRIDECMARPIVEGATALYVLHLVYEGVDDGFASECLADYERMMTGVRELGRGFVRGEIKRYPC